MTDEKTSPLENDLAAGEIRLLTLLLEGKYIQGSRTGPTIRAEDKDKEKPVSWHTQRNPHEPPCGKQEWRSGQRMRVTSIRDMSDQHLVYAIRLASEKPMHKDKLRALLAEDARRGLINIDEL